MKTISIAMFCFMLAYNNSYCMSVRAYNQQEFFGDCAFFDLDNLFFDSSANSNYVELFSNIGIDNDDDYDSKSESLIERFVTWISGTPANGRFMPEDLEEN